jgi:hypothetical protein
MTGLQVRAEQVRALYRQSLPILWANVVNALIVVVALWGPGPRPPRSAGWA